MKNPIWTKDEMILALDLYFKILDDSISPNHPEVIKLSRIMKQLPVHPKEFRKKNFRNVNGIVLRLANYKSVDPDYKGSGMINGGKQVQEVWDEFAKKREELNSIANVIKNSANINLPDIIYDEEDDFPEGKILYRMHKMRERNSRIIRELKIDASINGKLSCEICGFNFERVYGKIGEGYIECHHNKPVSEYEINQKTSKKDLSLVCSNCHRMIHRKRPWMKVEDLKKNITK